MVGEAEKWPVTSLFAACNGLNVYKKNSKICSYSSRCLLNFQKASSYEEVSYEGKATSNENSE